jgi:hypothetical protein
MAELDEDELIAAVDLVARTGATHFQVEYLPEGPPETIWYAYAQYRGARIISEGHPGPVEAAAGLALRILTGAKCKCGKLVTLDGVKGLAFMRPIMADGERFTLSQARTAGLCHWTRTGARWSSGCGR